MGQPITAFVEEGLGHSSYLVDLGDGTALVIDPSRIPSRQQHAAEVMGLRIAFTADTHSHADYISGSPDLVASVGATFIAPAEAQLEMGYLGVRHGDEVAVGNLSLRAIATPGHTPEHLAYLLSDFNGAPMALFSGGSLMVGTVGRTDLLGDDQSEALARSMYRSLRDNILVLPGDLQVYPTHSEGSFCSIPGGSARTTTIATELSTNPMLAMSSEEEFIDRLVSGFGSFPAYFRLLPVVNQHGVTHYETLPSLKPLDPTYVLGQVASGAILLDVRPTADFQRAHIPGSISMMLRPSFATWLGWLIESDRPHVFVIDGDQDEEDLVRQCLVIGHENLAGCLAGGMAAWVDAGLPTEATEVIATDDLVNPTVDTRAQGRAYQPILDVRQHTEFELGHIPGAFNVELGELQDADLPTEDPMIVMCGRGERAATAASILARRGRKGDVVLDGGYGAWASARGESIALGR